MMKLLTTLASIFALSNVHCEIVQTLTGATFDDFVKANPLSIVEFYTPWCGHCKKLAPEYEDAASFLDKRNVKLAKVNCDEEKSLCEQNGVKGYPTLKVLQDGEFSDYTGPRDSVGIVNFLEVFMRPILTTVTSDNSEQFTTSHKIAALAYLKSVDSIEQKLIHTVGKKFRSTIAFGVTTDAQIGQSYGLTAPGLVLLKKFDEPEVKFSGRFGSAEIEEFLTKESTPLMDEINAGNYNKYMEMRLPLTYFFYSSAADRQTIGAKIEAAAKSYKGKINFVYIDAAQFGNHAASLNLESKFPGLVIHQINGDLKYPFKGTLDEASISTFLADFVDNKLVPFFKSEVAPENNNGPVKIVVGSEYEKIVLDKNRDVLLKLYAPWCGHCKTLAPIFEELGEKFARFSDQVLIAKMDLTANNLPKSAGYSVQGYPTLKFIKAGTNQVIEYSGDRTLEALTEFILKNASTKIELDHEEL